LAAKADREAGFRQAELAEAGASAGSRWRDAAAKPLTRFR